MEKTEKQTKSSLTMQRTNSFFACPVAAALFIFLFCANARAQQTHCYPLSSSLFSSTPNLPPLEALPNASGQTGSFVTVPVPSDLCPGGGSMQAWHFADNAGLAFDNSDNFIGCGYTLEMLFKFDQLPGLFDPPWVFVVGFQPNLDNGLFLQVNPLFGNFLEIWQGNTKLHSVAFPSFNNWYKLTIVRNCAGTVQIYLGCQLFTTFNDSAAQIFLPGNEVVFFQDDPAVLAAEAQPGLVRNICISNFPKTAAEVQVCCDNLCNELTGTACTVLTYLDAQSCDPSAAGTDTLFFNNGSCDSLVITTTEYVPLDTTYLFGTTCFLEQVGTDVMILASQSGCDSVVLVITVLQTPLVIQHDLPTCIFEDVGTDTTQFGCDSIVVTNTVLIELDTLLLPSLSISQGSTVVILGQDVTEAGLYCETILTSEGCDSTTCQEVVLLVPTNEATRPGGIYAPNAFSPNGDGVNDSFTLFGGKGVSLILDLKIFDRRGGLIFEGKNLVPNELSQGWDGSFRGRPLGAGVFVWVAEVELADGRRTVLNGGITLTR